MKLSRLSIAGTALVLGLMGCSSPAADPSTQASPKEAQVALLALLDDTQQIIGGEWENEDSPSPRDCELPGSGDTGTTFTGARSLKAPELDDASVSKVLKFWEGEGFEAGSKTMGVLTSVLAVDPDNKAHYIELLIGEHATQLNGQAPCVPGDTLTELERVEGE
jgi:hypothetical protein